MSDLENIQTLDQAQHANFIWTWKSNGRGNKASIWIPYFDSLEKNKKLKSWVAEYNGGAVALDLNKIDFIMFYGACGQLPLEFLDDLARHQIPMMIHRRNVPSPYVFYPPSKSDDVDVLTTQILFRKNVIKRTYIARCLIRERLHAMQRFLPTVDKACFKMNKCRSVAEIRNIEANASAQFWKNWFSDLEVDASRREDHPINKALDAGSKFLFGILLRWVLFHKLSPCHGFLHEPSSYPSLPYDLMEPYRYIIERAAARVWKNGITAERQLVTETLSQIKIDLDEPVYVPATLQLVRRKNLLHGAVLALRAYLLEQVPRLVLPVEGLRKGGRPPNCGYSIPGEIPLRKQKSPAGDELRPGAKS